MQLLHLQRELLPLSVWSWICSCPQDNCLQWGHFPSAHTSSVLYKDPPPILPPTTTLSEKLHLNISNRNVFDGD